MCDSVLSKLNGRKVKSKSLLKSSHLIIKGGGKKGGEHRGGKGKRKGPSIKNIVIFETASNVQTAST